MTHFQHNQTRGINSHRDCFVKIVYRRKIPGSSMRVPQGGGRKRVVRKRKRKREGGEEKANGGAERQ